MGPRAVWLTGVRPYAVIAALCLLLYLPGFAAIPPLDRDEARFAQATRQMLETGDFLRIRFQDEARNNKPAGIYWLQAAAVGAFSTPQSAAIWPYRLPSLLGASLAALLTFAFGAALFADGADAAPARPIALTAAVLLASALGVVAEAHIAKTDAALLAAVTAGQGALGLAYVRSRAGGAVPAAIAAVFWGAEIAAILLKGPVGAALAAATAASLSIADREAGWLRGLRPAAGIGSVVLAIAPWLIAIEQATHGRFLVDSLAHDLGAKLVGGQEAHGAPPLSYLLAAFLTFWPGSLLLVPALLHGWQRRDAPVERFLLAWLVPFWVVLELVPTKLPHYVLPLYPALALLAAAALADDARRPRANAWGRRIGLVGKALWALATAILGVLVVGLLLQVAWPLAIAGGICGLLLAALAVALLKNRSDPAKAAAMLVMCAVLVAPPALSVLPRLDRLWLSRSAAALVARHPPAAARPLVAVGYNEPSLVFLLGTGLHIARPAAAATELGGGGEALVSGQDQAAFLRDIGARSLAARSAGAVAGFDYSNGRRMTLTLYTVEPLAVGARGLQSKPGSSR